MKSAVVYESCYGNTRRIAEAVAEALARHGEAELFTVEDTVPDPIVFDLIVAGAPTHVHGLSSGMSRRGVLRDQGHEGEDPGRGMRGWLKQLPPLDGTAVAAFDTRIDKPVILVGSAGRILARRLARHGGRVVAPAESFFVTEAEGPLADGELQRATEWAAQVAAHAGLLQPA